MHSRHLRRATCCLWEHDKSSDRIFSDFAILLARGRYSSSSYTFQLPRVGKYTQSTIQHYSFHQRHTTQLKESNYTARTASSFIFYHSLLCTTQGNDEGFANSLHLTRILYVPNELNSRRDLRFIIHTNNVVVYLRKSLGLNTNQPFRSLHSFQGKDHFSTPRTAPHPSHAWTTTSRQQSGRTSCGKYIIVH